MDPSVALGVVQAVGRVRRGLASGLQVAIGKRIGTEQAQTMGSKIGPEYVAGLRRMSGEQKLQASFQL